MIYHCLISLALVAHGQTTDEGHTGATVPDTAAELREEVGKLREETASMREEAAKLRAVLQAIYAHRRAQDDTGPIPQPAPQPKPEPDRQIQP